MLMCGVPRHQCKIQYIDIYPQHSLSGERTFSLCLEGPRDFSHTNVPHELLTLIVDPEATAPWGSWALEMQE